MLHSQYMEYKTLSCLGCDISSDIEVLQFVWLVMIPIIPMTISMLLSTYYYTKMTFLFKELANRFGISLRRFSIYPMAIVVSWLPEVLFRIASVVGFYSIWIEGISIIFSRSAGFINALVYGWERFEASRVASRQRISRNSDSHSFTIYSYHSSSTHSSSPLL